MPDDATERARDVAIAAQLSDAVIYNRDDAFRALAFKNRHLIVASLAAFASQQAPGMVLVPREPTIGMIAAGAHIPWSVQDFWTVMLAAAPRDPT